MKEVYELLQGAGWLTILLIAFIIAASVEDGRHNRRREGEGNSNPDNRWKANPDITPNPDELSKTALRQIRFRLEQ